MLGRPKQLGGGQLERRVGGQLRRPRARARSGRRSRACWRSCARPRARLRPRRWSGTGRRAVDSAKRSASAPISSMTLERVDDVALGLGHLRAVRVAHHAVQVDDGEGLPAGQPLAQHHHPGDPEEDDVVAGLHHAWSGSSVAQVGRVVRPAQRRERPQAAREPRVEDVSFLRSARRRGGRRRRSARAASRVGHRHVPVGAVPGRDAVAPPQLPADVPVVDVLHPVEEDLLEALRHERACGPRARRPWPCSAIGLTLMNHCVLRRGSMTSSLRWQRPMTISCGRARHEVAGRLQVGQDALACLVAASGRRKARRSR